MSAEEDVTVGRLIKRSDCGRGKTWKLPWRGQVSCGCVVERPNVNLLLALDCSERRHSEGVIRPMAYERVVVEEERGVTERRGGEEW